jgi:hypothetical protein
VWIDHYLRRFTQYGLRTGMYEPEGLFDDALCLRSYGAAVLGRSVVGLTAYDYPPEWLAHPPGDRRRSRLRTPARRALPALGRRDLA